MLFPKSPIWVTSPRESPLKADSIDEEKAAYQNPGY